MKYLIKVTEVCERYVAVDTEFYPTAQEAVDAVQCAFESRRYNMHNMAPLRIVEACAGEVGRPDGLFTDEEVSEYHQFEPYVRKIRCGSSDITLAEWLDIKARSYGYESYEELWEYGSRVEGYEKLSPQLLKKLMEI